MDNVLLWDLYLQYQTNYTLFTLNIHIITIITSCINWLCLSSFRLFMILTMAAWRYILRSSSIAWCVCSTSYCHKKALWYLSGIELLSKLRLLCYHKITCGVSRCTVPAIRNFVLLLLYFILRLMMESEVNSCNIIKIYHVSCTLYPC